MSLARTDVLQRIGEAAQDLVAGAVAEDVVDAFEVVDVEHDDGNRLVRAAGVRERPPQALVEGPVVVEPGQRIGLRLVLEPRADLGVVEREGRGVAEALRELELVVVERGGLAETVDVERAFDRAARDQRDRDQGLGLVCRSAGDRHHARVEMRLIDAHGLAMLDAPTRQAGPEWAGVREDLLRPFVPRPDRGEQPARLVGLVDRERIVRDEVRQRIGDAVEERVQALLGQDLVEHVGQATIRLDEGGAVLGGPEVSDLGDEPEIEGVVAHWCRGVGGCRRSSPCFGTNKAKRERTALISPG